MAQREDCGDVNCPCMLTVVSRLHHFLARVKCMSWYFSGANFRPFFSAHASDIPCCTSNFLQFSSVVLDQVSMFLSSKNPSADVEGVYSIGRGVLTKNRKRIGDRDEP